MVYKIQTDNSITLETTVRGSDGLLDKLESYFIDERETRCLKITTVEVEQDDGQQNNENNPNWITGKHFFNTLYLLSDMEFNLIFSAK